MTKKILSLFTIFFLMLFTLVACGSKGKITIQVETEMKVGETYQVKYELENIDESVELSWKVSDTGMAELDSEKLTVKALKEGTFTLTVTAKTGEMSSKEMKVVKEETTLTKYKIQYQLNGGIAEKVPLEYDGTKDVTLPTPTKEGYNFLGWYNNSDFLGNIIEKIEAGIAKDITLYARWIEKTKYTITLLTDWGSEENHEIKLEYFEGKGCVLPTPMKEGFKFEGWYDNREFEGDVVSKVDAGSIGNKTFYAKWTKSQYEDPGFNIHHGIYSEDYQEFATWIKQFNTTNRVFISFDFDNSEEIGEKSYYFETIVNSNKIDEEGYVHDVDIPDYFGYAVEYQFYSYELYPAGCGINYDMFYIKCNYYENYDYIDENSLVFELQEKNNNVYKYELKSGNLVIMEIEIQIKVYFETEEVFIEKVITLLKDNMVFIK